MTFGTGQNAGAEMAGIHFTPFSADCGFLQAAGNGGGDASQPLYPLLFTQCQNPGKQKAWSKMARAI